MTWAIFMQSLGLVLDPYVLLVIFCSAIFGLFVGCIPGLTATMATALLVPITFFMPPVPAVAAIVTATAMAIFSGDIPGALLRIPGTPASAAYTDEAYQMTLKGQAEVALGAFWVFLSALTYAGYLIYSGQLVQRVGSLRLVGWATTVACLCCILQFLWVRPLSAALANAIFDATGVRLRQLPLTAEKIKAGWA